MLDHYILTHAIVTDGHSYLKENCDIEIKGNKILKIGQALKSNKDIKKIDLDRKSVV